MGAYYSGDVTRLNPYAYGWPVEVTLDASRLETRRFAAMRGATTEWHKMEGITSAASGTWHPHS
jgi:hypothetical protein